MRTYGTIYLAFHGSGDGVQVGEAAIPLAQLAGALGEVPAGVVHLGSCSVLKNGRVSAEDFLRLTRAKAISGYERDVEWLDSAALDIAWLGYIAEYQSVGTALRYFRQRYASLIEYLKLLWLGFDAPWWKPHVLKVGVGGVDAISGEPFDPATLNAGPRTTSFPSSRGWMASMPGTGLSASTWPSRSVRESPSRGS